MPALDQMAELNAVLHVVEILSIVGGGGVFIYKLGTFVTGLTSTVARQNEIFQNHADDDHAAFTRFTDEIVTIKDRMEKIGEALTTIAVQREQIAGIRAEVAALRAEVADLRRGQGFVNK